MTNTRTRLPLPEPVAWKCANCGNVSSCEGVGPGDNWCCSGAICGDMKPLHTADAMHAYSDAENAALRSQASGQSLRVLEMTAENAALQHAYEGSMAACAVLAERVKVLEDALLECLSAANDDSLTRWQDAATAARTALAARKAAP